MLALGPYPPSSYWKRMATDTFQSQSLKSMKSLKLLIYVYYKIYAIQLLEFLTCASPDGDVLGGEPQVLANLVGGSRPPPPVGLLLHPGSRSHQVDACGPPRLLAPPDECRRR